MRESPDEQKQPPCVRVVGKMIRCSTDRSYRRRLRRNRARVIRSCQKHGLEDAKRCVRIMNCHRFVRCLRK